MNHLEPVYVLFINEENLAPIAMYLMLGLNDIEVLKYMNDVLVKASWSGYDEYSLLYSTRDFFSTTRTLLGNFITRPSSE